MGYWLAIAALTVSLSVFLHAFALRALYRRLAHTPINHSLRMGLMVHALFLLHCTEVMLFAAAFYAGVEYLHLGQLKGEFNGHFREYIYFSLVSYTSLGLGDVYPYGPVRLLTGIEALTGLMMIGWSASFSYFCMSRLWLGSDD
jgi:hypothetical protein